RRAARSRGSSRGPRRSRCPERRTPAACRGSPPFPSSLPPWGEGETLAEGLGGINASARDELARAQRSGRDRREQMLRDGRGFHERPRRETGGGAREWTGGEAGELHRRRSRDRSHGFSRRNAAAAENAATRDREIDPLGAVRR